MTIEHQTDERYGRDNILLWEGDTLRQSIWFLLPHSATQIVDAMCILNPDAKVELTTMEYTNVTATEGR